jgi:hypothetical protein
MRIDRLGTRGTPETFAQTFAEVATDTITALTGSQGQAMIAAPVGTRSPPLR